MLDTHESAVAAHTAYAEIRERFLDKQVDRRGRAAILLALVAELGEGGQYADFSAEEALRISRAITSALEQKRI